MTVIFLEPGKRASWRRPVRPLLQRAHGLFGWARGLAVLALASLLGVGTLALPPTDRQAIAVAENKSIQAAPNPWVDVVRPLQLYSLQSSEFGQQPRLYEARRQKTGSGREDILTFGQFGGDDPYLRLSLYRIGDEDLPQANFFVDLARNAAEAGLAVTRSEPPAALATRFGNFETSMITLAGNAAQDNCLGYRFHAERPGFRIAGVACGSPGKALDQTALACNLDRLDLLSAASDRELAQFFAAAELNRNRACDGGLIPVRSQARAEPSATSPQKPQPRGKKPSR